MSAKEKLQVPFGVHSNDGGTHPRPKDKWNMCLLMEGCVWLEHVHIRDGTGWICTPMCMASGVMPGLSGAEPVCMGL